MFNVFTKVGIAMLLLFAGCIGDNSTDYDWESDDISLMQHESEGYYGCFGCSTPDETPALCIDPSMEMKLVEETEQRYCNNNFEVIEAN